MFGILRENPNFRVGDGLRAVPFGFRVQCTSLVLPGRNLVQERSRKTEVVFLVALRGSGGKFEIPPGAFSFASVFFLARQKENAEPSPR